MFTAEMARKPITNAFFVTEKALSFHEPRRQGCGAGKLTFLTAAGGGDGDVAGHGRAARAACLKKHASQRSKSQRWHV